MADEWTKAAATEFFDELRKLSMAAGKLAATGEKAVELMGAAVSQLDEIRKEVSTVAAATSNVADDGLQLRKGSSI